MDKRTSVLIADNSEEFCTALSNALQRTDRFTVAGIANDGEQAMALLEERRPDILVLDLMLAKKDGISLGGRLEDCGTLVFDREKQDVHAGGSGCGCSAVTLCGYYLDQLNKGKLKRILFCGTGALLSPTSTQQNLPIPGICHAVAITTQKGGTP